MKSYIPFVKITASILCYALCALPTTQGQWTIEQMPNQHVQFTATALGEMVFLGPGGSNTGFHTFVDVYNAGTGEWENILEVSEPRVNATGIAANGKVYFAGGLANDWLDPIMLDVVDIYTLEGDEWTTASLSEGRSELKAARAGDKLLFAGGISDVVYDGNNPTILATSAVVDMYDLITGEWSIASLSEPRVGMAAAAGGDYAVFAGGQTESGEVTNAIDLYHAPTDTWSTLELSEAKGWCSAEALGNKIYIAGGITANLEASGKVEILDLETMTWESAELVQPRGGMRSGIVGKKIFFAGGGIYDLVHYYWTPQIFNHVDIYDGEEGVWTTDQLQHGRINHAAIGAADKFIVAGGVPAFGLMEVFTDPNFTVVEDALPASAISVVPNPATSQVFIDIKTEKSTNTRMELFDLTGKCVRKVEGIPGTLNLDDLARGTYLIKVFNNDRSVFKKLIVQ